MFKYRRMAGKNMKRNEIKKLYMWKKMINFAVDFRLRRNSRVMGNNGRHHCNDNYFRKFLVTLNL